MKLKYLLIVLMLPFVSLFAQEKSQTLLPLKQTGVEDFLKQYPDYDGRGTIVLVFDTGVDLGLDGLTKTSTGEVKIIDVRDFTGQGDMPFYEADIDDEDGIYFFINEDKGYKVNGANKLSMKAADEKYYIGMLPEKLWRYSGSGAIDINGNGKEDDKFFFVTFLTGEEGKQFWVVYVDVNNNGDLSDEKPLRNYKEKFDYFSFAKPEGLPYFSIAVNIYPEAKKVTFVFDDGAHGTHCAGIAAGNRIGETDLNGVAPGAYVISGKLGINGSSVTESMKKCYEYATEIAKELNMPMVVNMSFGIGSVYEGDADMEKYLDQFVKENPYINICLSAGNSGPGLSCSGLPSSSESIISSGGLLTTEVAGDMYGIVYKKDVIYDFSARGGEAGKPDVITPGGCVSTVPNFSRGDGFQGTSMASPHTAGLISLLLSAAKQEFPDLKIPSLLVKKVLIESAVKMDGYLPIDQGGGIANIGNAWELLKKYIKAGELKKFETYTISSFAPNQPGNSAANLYIRNGSYLTGNESFGFNITRNNTIGKDKFYRIYNIKSDADWLIPAQKSVHLRNDQAGSVRVRVDKSKMTEPGLYNTKLQAYRQGDGNALEFEMMATVIIPYEFTAANNYSMGWKNKYFDQGMYERYFLNVPPGATAVRIQLNAAEGKHARLWADLYGPDGVSVQFMRGINSVGGPEEYVQFVRDLKPGVYELDVHSHRLAEDGSTYNLKVEFIGLDRLDNMNLDKNHNAITVVDYFGKAGTYNLSGELRGYQKDFVVHTKGYEVKEVPFVINKNEAKKVFNVSMSKIDYMKTTDFGLRIVDEEGKEISSAGLNQKEGNITVTNNFDAESTNLVLVIFPGYANETLEADIHINEVTDFKTIQTVTVKNDGRTNVRLYPGVEEELNCTFEKPADVIPSEAKPYGKIFLKSTSTDETEFETLVFFNF